jgi:predicted small metal-binding protein
MKEFCCGDVVPGCGARFKATSNEEILAQVAAHARADHGMTDIPQSLVDMVVENIQVAA